MKFAFAVALFCVFGAAVADEAVIALSDDDFGDFLEKNEQTMIEFYAPWCGHCKKLAPEFEAAAEELKEDGIPLAKVDCTADESKEICGKYEVRGYPTIKFFQKGKDTAYELGRTKDAIVKYIRARSGPAITILEEADAAEQFTKKNTIAVIQFSEKVSDVVDEVSNALRDDASFGHVSSADIAESLGAEMDSIVLFRTFDEPKAVYDGKMTEKDITAFITEESFPLVGQIGPQNYKKYMDRGLPLMWIAVEKSDDPVLAKARTLSPDYKGKLSMVELDGVQFASHIKNLGHTGDLPGVIITSIDNKKYLHTEEEITDESLATFLKSWDEGKLDPFLKSQEIPEESDEPVTVLVGKSFDDVVIDNKKDVLVEFYAPWCGHCKKLEPEYDDLGERWKDNENVVIAKMDATENDGPIEISGFPTIVFFKGDDKENHVMYQGERTADALDTFLKENCVNYEAEAPEKSEL